MGVSSLIIEGVTLMEYKIVPEHIQVRQITEIALYPSHEGRYESQEFKKIKREFKEEHARCWINNGFCEGVIETHHDIIEYASNNAIDWNKVKQDHPNIDHVDQKEQMMELCSRHHRHKYVGRHETTDNIWKLQKYMTDEYIHKFEDAVHEQEKRDREKRSVE